MSDPPLHRVIDLAVPEATAGVENQPRAGGSFQAAAVEASAAELPAVEASAAEAPEAPEISTAAAVEALLPRRVRCHSL